eukprot:GHUV01055896.1.p1 GENE.GHUV01055896.1~~GHUV01055896.1.p1  ORF type:complete len:100 (+),score=20.30 GHUV01055896.1:188-487(+)
MAVHTKQQHSSHADVVVANKRLLWTQNLAGLTFVKLLYLRSSPCAFLSPIPGSCARKSQPAMMHSCRNWSLVKLDRGRLEQWGRSEMLTSSPEPVLSSL